MAKKKKSSLVHLYPRRIVSTRETVQFRFLRVRLQGRRRFSHRKFPVVYNDQAGKKKMENFGEGDLARKQILGSQLDRAAGSTTRGALYHEGC
ncbi:hypothetical protein CEXT_117631 [Caerostris extrusa]|uniref:Uncharacterized protein n=1 Tax=Caerostris extrusa TaxID=172846 RepID=A0AAV4QUT1_CAEEX|nr:hypothetical protein CEXT_117631 [Caerostris extrusa]